MPSDNKILSIVLNERPAGTIVLGQTFHEKLVPAPTEADLKEGQVVLEPYYLSIDPAMRGWIRDMRSYLPPVQIGEVMRSFAVGKIVASKSPRFNVGDLATGWAGWRELAVLDGDDLTPVQRIPGIELPDVLGVLGITGLTAYFGLTKIALPKPGELVVVSGAAGATGSVVGQICKLKGARVVGIAGSDEKCKWLKEELGFDEALNYKAPDFQEKFLEATKDYIDVYWDNVRGEILDLALLQAQKGARFVMCGGISSYNTEGGDSYPYKNLSNVTRMRIRMEGFIVLDHRDEYPAATLEMAKWVAEGKIKSKNYIVHGGVKEAPRALRDLFTGVNTGKMVVEVKKPEEA